MKYKIVSKDDEKRTLVTWTGDITNLIALRDICQYFLDSITGLKDFLIMDCENNIYYDFLGITTHLGMRKRTFYERMENVTTGIIREV